MSGLLDAVRETMSLSPRAFEGGLLSAAACGALGVCLRWRRLVWTGFVVPEAATVGAAAAMGLETFLDGLGITANLPSLLLDPDLMSVVAAALAIAWLLPVGRSARSGGERAAAVCFLLAATLTVLLIEKSPHGKEEVRALTEGKSLLFLRPVDVSLLAWSMPPLVLLTLLFARPLAAVAFDRDHARAVGHPVVRLEAGFAVAFLALVAIVAPRAGAAFTFAYLTLPAAAAERLFARPLAIAAASTAMAALGFVVGATASVRYDLPYSTSAAAGGLLVAGVAMILDAAGRLLPRRREF